MKAVRMYAPRDLRVEEVPMPLMAEDEALVQVMAVGVCGSDLPRVNEYGAHVSPIIPGHEFSGVVTQVGPRVRSVRVGDHVTVPPLIPCNTCEWCRRGLYSLCEHYDYYGSRRDGAMAEYIAVKDSNLLRVPKNVSFETAATADPCANALHGLDRAGFTAKDSLCVYGAGPIGLFAILAAKQRGAACVIAVDVQDEKLALAKKAGADVVVNSLREDPAPAVKAATNGLGADVVIDFSGVPSAQLNSVRSASKMGRVVLLGISHQGLHLTAEDVDLIMREQLQVIGSWNSFTKPFPGGDWTGTIDLFDRHGVTAEDIISHRLPLDEVPGIFEQIAKGELRFSKIMFFPHGDPANAQ